MLLGELLHEGVLKTGMEARDKHEAIDELADLLVESHEIPLSLRDHVVEAIMNREKTMSTGMENGIALPHGASDKVSDIIAALGIAPDGIPFESLDGQPAKIIVLLILPRQEFQAHVRTLAGIAHLLNNAGFRERLIAAPDAEAALALIEHEEDQDSFDSYRGSSSS